MAAGPAVGTKVFTHLQERRGGNREKKKEEEEATQMRPTKRTDWINSWWREGGRVRGREGGMDGEGGGW